MPFAAMRLRQWSAPPVGGDPIVLNAFKLNTSGGTVASTPSFTSTPGSTIWIGTSDASGQGGITISDNKGNNGNFPQIGTTQTSGSGAQARRFYCKNILGGSGHIVTLTWASASDATAHVLEIGNVNTSAPLDVSAQNDDGNPPWTLASGVTPSVAKSIAIALTATAFAGTWSESSGFSIQTQEGDNGLYWTGCAASRVLLAAAALNPSFTISGGGSDCAVTLDIFKGL